MEAMGLALNGSWLDAANNTDMTVTTGCTGIVGNTVQLTTYGYVYPYWSYPVYVTSPARPIKLTMSEIERLRKAAKADKAIKAILAKFTEQIEITVDFE